MIALPGGDYSTAIAVDPQKNYFSLSAGTQTPCTVTTGTGISADNPVLNCGNVPEPYVSLLDKTTGTTTLFYTNLGVTFTATLQGVQQWQKTNSDGSTTIYTRNTIDAALGAFTPWEKQQSTNGDLFQTVGVVNTAIQNLFIVPGTTTKNPMLDSTGSSPTTLSTAELLALADATGGPVPSSLQSSQSATVQNGSSQTFTIYASGSNTVDQTIKLTLAQGDPTNKFVCTGAKEIAFDSSGNATVTIPAGQDHVTLTLVDGSNTSSADQLSLTASIVDPNAPAGSTPVSSNTFTVNFASPNPFAGTGSTTPVTPDRTIVGDFKPAEFQTELPAGTNPDLAALKWGSILKRVDGQTKTVTYTDSYGNTITNTVALTYVYTHTKKLKGSASHLISHNHATPPTH